MELDIVSWTFDLQEGNLDLPVYIDYKDATRSISTNEARTLVRKLVSGLHEHGVKEGDCVCTISFNDINYTPLYLGIIGSGARFTGANPGYTPRELTHHIKITGAKILLTELKTLPTTLEAANECKIPHSDIFVLNYNDEPVPSPHRSWKELLAHGEKDWVKIDDSDTPATFVSTSGTSGLPKAAILPHSYLISQGQFQEIMLSKSEKISTLIAVPPFHVFTVPVQHALPLRTGSPAYIMPRFEETNFVKALEEFAITQTVVVPPILMTLAKRDCKELDALRRIFVGGSVATNGMQQQLYSRLNSEARIIQVYGMTEVGWATTWTKTIKDESGSVGQPLPGTHIRLVASDGHILDRDSMTGEVQIYTPASMKGYLNNDTATAEAFASDGWICTGDIGYKKEGNWYIIDRTKDLIKVRGWQVSPAEIEAAMLEHPDVIDAGVIGIPASDGCGQAPAAFVKKKNDSNLDLAQVRIFLATRLARYKNVEKVEFVDAIPRNPTGKILRRVLRDTRVPDVLTEGIIAAQQYSTELKKLEEYRRRSMTSATLESNAQSPSSTDSDSSKLKRSIERMEPPIEAGRKSKKRKCCAPSPLVYWRKLRSGIRGRVE